MYTISILILVLYSDFCLEFASVYLFHFRICKVYIDRSSDFTSVHNFIFEFAKCILIGVLTLQVCKILFTTLQSVNRFRSRFCKAHIKSSYYFAKRISILVLALQSAYRLHFRHCKIYIDIGMPNY